MPKGIYKHKSLSKKHKEKLSNVLKGRIFSKKHRNNLSKALKGRVLTKTWKRKMSEARKGKIPWNKGKKMNEKIRKKMSEGRKGIKFSEAHKRNIGKTSKGRKHTKKTKQKISDANKGKQRTKEAIAKMRKNHADFSREKNPNWLGGSSFEPYSVDFNESLKKDIRKRDNYTCQKCGKLQKDELKQCRRKLAIHHIDYNKKNCKENNLITLCCSCNGAVNCDRLDWMNYFRNKLKKHVNT